MNVLSSEKIDYFGIPIEYELTRKNVKNINLRIHENGEITVSANRSVSLEDIRSFMESRADWIVRCLAELERYNEAKPDNSIYNGKKLYFLGKAYEARLIKGTKECVETAGEEIFIYLKEENEEKIKKIYKKWLIGRAEEIFPKLVKECYEEVVKGKIPYPAIKIRNMKTRWGTCKPSAATITLNLQLIKAEKDDIKQVVVHEFMHFFEQNHSRKFYMLLDRAMPLWRDKKKNLEEKYKDGIF